MQVTLTLTCEPKAAQQLIDLYQVLTNPTMATTTNKLVDKPQPATKAEPPKAAPSDLLNDIRKEALRIADQGLSDQLKAIMPEYGAEKLSLVDAKHHAELLERMRNIALPV